MAPDLIFEARILTAIRNTVFIILHETRLLPTFSQASEALGSSTDDRFGGPESVVSPP